MKKMNTAAGLLMVLAGLHGEVQAQVNRAAPAAITQGNIQGMDLEAAMMTVQSNRANLLEAQLKDQMASVQAKNEQVARLNSLLVAANKISAKLPAGAKAADALPGGAEKADFDARAKAAGYSFASATKGDLDAAIQNIKSSIDAASNSQQMDMLRLQSLSNKRNEAFETMTNFIKKMQESRSSIIGNMR